MKNFILGTITGITIASSVAFATTYTASPASFKVLVNGKEFTSDPPAMVINDRTYLPLRAIGDALGVPVEWNDELKQAEVGDVTATKNESTQSSESSDLIETEILTTKEDIAYKENNNIPNLGNILNIDPYEAYSSGEYTFYFYDTSNYTLNPLRAYEYILKNTGFTVSYNDDKIFATNSNDVLNFDYYITAQKQKSENRETVFVMIKNLNK